MYSSILVLHIIGACATGLVAAYTAIVLAKGEESHYTRLAQALGLLAGFETATGTLMSVLSPNITALSLCSNIAVYLGVVFALEAVLFWRMKKAALLFPIHLAFSPAAAGLLYMALAIAKGF